MSIYIIPIGPLFNEHGPDGALAIVCGDLGPHCADCTRPAENLCDYPVGDGLTCDRSICRDHGATVGPDIHYCTAHMAMWEEFRANQGDIDVISNQWRPK